MQTKIKDYLFVPDAFGVMEYFTLQHPRFEAKKCYWLPIKKKVGFMVVFHELAKMAWCMYISVTAEIKYKKIKGETAIAKDRIEYIKRFL